MKKTHLKAVACMLAALMAASVTACSFGTNTSSDSPSSASESEASSAVQTDSDTEEEPDTDIGEHKDYTKEDAEGYMSNGVLVVSQDGHYRAMDLFAATSADMYIIQLNKIKDSLDPDVNVYSLVAPTASELYCPANYQEYVSSQQDLITGIGEALINVKSIDPCETLNNHNAEPIYSRTDHHWQGLGAYYACKVFAKAAGVEYPDISEYEKVDVDGYIGSMTAFTDYQGTAMLESDPETFTYYNPTNTVAASYYNYAFEYITGGKVIEQNDAELYMSYIKGDSYCVKINTDVNNGRKLLVVKDSFGNAAVPFLTGSFEEIVVVDMRYLEVNLLSLVEEMEITDVLFLMNTFSAAGANADNLETLCNNPNVGEIEEVSSMEEPVYEETDSEASGISSDDVMSDSSLEESSNTVDNGTGIYDDGTGAYNGGMGEDLTSGNDYIADDGYNDEVTYDAGDTYQDEGYYY